MNYLVWVPRNISKPAAPKPVVGCSPVNDDEVLNPESDELPNRLPLHTFLRPAS